MSQKDRKDFMLLLETFAVEAQERGQDVDIMVDRAHVARAHYEPRGDCLALDTLKGEFVF